MVCMKWHSSIFSERQTDLLSMWLSYCTWGVYWGVGEGRTCVKTLIKDTECNRIIILKSWRIVHKAHCYPYYSSPSHPICKFTLIIKKLGYGTWRQRENTCKVNIFFKKSYIFLFGLFIIWENPQLVWSWRWLRVKIEMRKQSGNIDFFFNCSTSTLQFVYRLWLPFLGGISNLVL